MGEFDAARAVWRKAHDNDPENAALKDTLKRLRSNCEGCSTALGPWLCWALPACTHLPATRSAISAPLISTSPSLQVSGRISINTDSLPGQTGQHFVSPFTLQAMQNKAV